MLAGLLLCLHTLMPHVHAEVFLQPGEITLAEAPNPGHSLFDLLSGLVQGDLGQEHLENFTEEQPDALLAKTFFAPAAAPLLLYPTPPKPLVGVLSAGRAHQELLLPKSVALQLSCPQRGPPVAT